jgi:hypothetical protein
MLRLRNKDDAQSMCGTGTSDDRKSWTSSVLMEFEMINLKVLSTAAALALALPLVVPTASFAQGHPGHGGGMRGGGGFARPAMGAHPGGAGPRMGGGRVGWNGGGGWHGGGWHGGGGGFWPGAVAGAVVGGAIAANSYYGPGYGYYGYGPGYYDDSYGYYDGGAPDAVAVAPGGDASYCAQRYKSYDPASGTFLGYDGQRHPCP